MIAVDTSLLAYAVNRYGREHGRAAGTLETLVNGNRPWAIPTPVVREFLEAVTHPHRVARPLAPREAAAFIAQLLESPSARALSPGEHYLEAVMELLEGTSAQSLPPGLEVAAVLREHGIRELLSADRGMSRFGFLAVVDPIHGEPWTGEEPPVRRYRRLPKDPRGSRGGAPAR